MAALALIIRFAGGIVALGFFGMFVASLFVHSSWHPMTYLGYSLGIGIGSTVAAGLLLKATAGSEMS